jgi:hypothetical protein
MIDMLCTKTAAEGATAVVRRRRSGGPAGRRVGCCNKMKAGHFGTRLRYDHAGRGGDDCGGGRPLIRAIKTSDFERHFQLVEADHCHHAGAVTGMNGTGPGSLYNL